MANAHSNTSNLFRFRVNYFGQKIHTTRATTFKFRFNQFQCTQYNNDWWHWCICNACARSHCAKALRIPRWLAILVPLEMIKTSNDASRTSIKGANMQCGKLPPNNDGYSYTISEGTRAMTHAENKLQKLRCEVTKGERRETLLLSKQIQTGKSWPLPLCSRGKQTL